MPSCLHQRFSGFDLLFRRLGTFPTAIEALEGISPAGTLWCKREDLSAQPYGGNKVRKLECLLPDAKGRGDTVLSMGATGSNHLLATCLHGAAMGLKIHGLVVPQPVTEHVRTNARLLSHHAEQVWPARWKISVPWVGMVAWAHCRAVAEGEATWIPAGGSSPLGTVGWVEAALEIGEQVAAGDLPQPTDVFVPFGSGGTAAGLWVGFAVLGWNTRVHAVRVMDWPYVRRGTLTALGRKTHALLRAHGASLPPLDGSRLVVDPSAIGSGYGFPTDEGLAAISLGEERGLKLEPTYSAKALAACLRAMEAGAVGEHVLFVDTLNSRDLTALLSEAPEGMVPELQGIVPLGL